MVSIVNLTGYLVILSYLIRQRCICHSLFTLSRKKYKILDYYLGSDDGQTHFLNSPVAGKHGLLNKVKNGRDVQLIRIRSYIRSINLRKWQQQTI